MTINFYDTTDGLFDVLGKVFKSIGVINIAANTTIPTAFTEILTKFDGVGNDFELNHSIAQIQQSQTGFERYSTATASTLQAIAQQYLQRVVAIDRPMAVAGLAAAINELIRQMVDNSETVRESVISAVATPSLTYGDGVLAITTRRADGQKNGLMFAETIEVTTTGSNQLLASGEALIQSLDVDWPGGSGVTTGLQLATSASSELTNSGFDSIDSATNFPDGWIPVSGTPGTQFATTTVEIQSVTIAGTPTSGYYYLHYTNAAGKKQTTAPLAWNADGTAVSTALRALSGLSSITVSTTGTLPNYVHSVTFGGVGGDITALTYSSFLDTGTITIGTPTPGTAQVFSGERSLKLDSFGAEIQLANRFLPDTGIVYGLNCWLLATGTPTGSLRFSLKDGINGTVIVDDQGGNNELTVDVSTLTSSWQSLVDLVADVSFRLPSQVPDLVYFEIRVVAGAAGGPIYIDGLSLSAMNELYQGGPFVRAFAGSTAFQVGDTFSVAVTNNRAGVVHDWMDRVFGLRTSGKLIPTAATTFETIPNSIVS